MTNSIEKEKTGFLDSDTNLAMIVHDLRNPVSSGIMAIKLLEDEKMSPLNDYQKEIIENLNSGFKYMKNLIENILGEYRFKNNQYVIEKQPVDFVNLVESIIDETKYLFYEKNHILKFNCDVKNRILYVDNLAIQRAVNNLFVNASKYSPLHSTILVNVREIPEGIIFSVENPGAGVELDNPDEIFQKFVSYSVNSKSVSSGLGLYIVKKIIEAHDGKISFESKLNEFTRVSFIIPQK